jgi:hypothetical protein
VRLIGNHDDVIPLAVGLLGINVLVELVDQAEDIPMVLLQEPFQFLARAGAGCLFIRQATANECPINLAVEIVSVGHEQEGILGGNPPPDLLRKKSHRIGFSAPLGVPKNA